MLEDILLLLAPVYWSYHWVSVGSSGRLDSFWESQDAGPAALLRLLYLEILPGALLMFIDGSVLDIQMIILYSRILWGMVPKKISSHFNPQNLSILSYMAKGVIKLRSGGVYHGRSGWAQNAITCILITERQRAFWDRRWSSVILCCGHTPRATRSWKKQGMDSPMEPSKGEVPCKHLDFRLLDFGTVREFTSAIKSHQVWGNLLWQL